MEPITPPSTPLRTSASTPPRTPPAAPRKARLPTAALSHTPSVSSTDRRHNALINLDRGRQILTRYQERNIRRIFRFLDLPGEIKNLIYEMCIDVSGPQRLLQRYYDDVRDTTDIRTVQAPLIWARCPTIFLVCREMFLESRSLVLKRGLTFDHGLLDLLTIRDFAPKSLFRNVSYITIDDSGHPLFQENIMAPSWLGYTSLIEQVGEILSSPKGHQLKSFTLSLTSPELAAHVTTCWTADFKCGFRDTLRTALNSLRKVRGIKRVSLIGLPEPEATELAASMMRPPPRSFFDLPRELRDMVYEHALDWSDISIQLARTMAGWTDRAARPPYPPRTTPTILLLNRQITREAQAILRKRPLTITFPGDHNMQRQHLVPNMRHFITPATLRFVQHLALRIESWEWIYSLDHVLPHFASVTALATTANTSNGTVASHFSVNPHIPAVHSVHVDFRDSLRSRFLAAPGQQYPDHTLHTSLGGLARLRNLTDVVFTGDLPTEYTEPLRRIMMMPATTSAALPRLMAIRGSGEVVPVDEDGDE